MPTVVEQATELVVARRYHEAERLLRPYLARRRDPAAAYLLGHSLAQQNRPAQAEYYLRMAASVPGAPLNARVEHAVALFDSGRRDEGIEALAPLARENPGHMPAHVLLAKMCLRGGLFVDAMESCLRAINLAPQQPETLCLYGSCLMGLGRPEEAVGWFRRAADLQPDDPEIRARLCFAMTSAGVSPDETFAEHLLYGRLIVARAPRLPAPEARPARGRRLRVAFLSPDLREHPVGRFVEPLLRGLDRSRFEVVCYDVGFDPDEMTNRLRSCCDGWVEAMHLADADLARRIRADGVDILIDLAGLTGNTRVGVLASRPAPLGATYLGYPNTTGIPGVDVRFVDSTTDPEGTDHFASERLVRLPGCMICFTPDAALGGNHLPVRAAHEPVTFGSFNNPTKLTGTTLSLWREVLGAVPGSRLALKGKGFDDPRCRSAFARRLAGAGIDLARVVFLTYAPKHEAHLRAYGEIDIALDTFPYTGTTTTCEALWMGVPVVTLAGRTHASRVSASILSAAGCPQWVAGSDLEYVRLAAQLAATASGLRTGRAALRARVASSPLADASGFARAFGDALMDEWERVESAGPAAAAA
jgi:protein O-GlcNAc transferase